MPFPLIPLVTAGISGLAGLFGGKKQNVPSEQYNNSTSTNTGSQNTSNFSFQNPELSQGQRDLSNAAIADVIRRFRNGGPDLSGFAAGGLREINNAGDIQNKILDNILASRGQTFSPSASFSKAALESSRIGEGTRFLQTVPLVQRQFQQENLDNILNVFRSLPTAYTSGGTTNNNFSNTSETNQRGTQLTTNPGNPLAGLFSGLGQGLLAPSSPGGGPNIESILQALGIGKG